MNILFLGTQGPDYLHDAVYHGLSILYPEFHSNILLGYMYNNIAVVPDRRYTLYGTLPSNNVPYIVTDAEILSTSYDVVIYGSIQRYNKYHDKIHSKTIICIDGEDNTAIFTQYMGNSTYFKRELLDSNASILPISFAIPESKVFNGTCVKQQQTASLIPGNLSTYIYKDEASYFNDYRISKYGITCKKGGWDCLRHYEIVLNKCVPHFTDIDRCPPRIMANWNKKLLLHVKNNINTIGDEEYERISAELHTDLMNSMTTTKLVEYILGTIK